MEKRSEQSLHSMTTLFAVSVCFMVVSLIGCIATFATSTHLESWIKLTKFSLSFCTYAVVMEWLSKQFFEHSRVFLWSSRSACVGAIVELTILFTRALLSFHNLADSLLFLSSTTLILRLAILPATALIAVTFVLVWKQSSTSAVLRSGLLWATGLALVGCIPALFLLAGSDSPASSLRHTGLPLLGWSTTGGDLRIAHFLGVHSLQLMPAVTWLALKSEDKMSRTRQMRFVSNIGFLLLSAIILLTVQGLLGESLFAPNALTCTVVLISFSAVCLIAKQTASCLGSHALRKAVDRA